MNTPSFILDAQLEILEEQADVARWKQDHEMAMLGYQVESLIGLALETLGRIRKLPQSFPADQALHYFRRWHATALNALACVEFVEREHFQLEKSDEFRFAINEAAIALDYQRVLAAQNRLASGLGKSLDEILHAPSAR